MAEPLAGIRIVIADDHGDTRDILEQVLGHLGATVTAVATGREALALVAAADVVVTDLAMPGGDGVWLLEQLTLQGWNVPVLALSGFAEQHVPRFADAPFTRKLLKPVDPWRLADIIIEVLQAPPPDETLTLTPDANPNRSFPERLLAEVHLPQLPRGSDES